MKYKIKLFDPVIDSREEKSVLRVLKSHNWASGAGTGEVEKFENSFCNYVNSKKCVAVNNGTSALHLALSLIDIKGKEVILPSLSFVSTAHAIIYNGGIPTFADVDEKSLCIDYKSISKIISKKTAAIIPVHFGGMPANMKKINNVSKLYGCPIVEDAAHASGAIYDDKKIGSHSFAVCFSFHPVKNLAMPTGGLISLNGKNSKKNQETLKIRRWCGISNRKGSFYDVKDLGWNMYMNEFSAAIGQAQLSKLDSLNKKRKKIAKIFSKELECKNKMPYDENCSYHLYWIRVKNRKKFMNSMKECNIETGIHYRPIHEMSYYHKMKFSDLHITEKISSEIISIPNHPNLTDNDIDFIIKNVNSYC